MNVITAETAGFCFGVERAVNMVRDLLAAGKKPLYTYGPIIHNETVVGELEEAGVRILHDRKELAEAEALARREKRGLWKLDNPIPPWEFRKTQRIGRQNGKDSQ